MGLHGGRIGATNLLLTQFSWISCVYFEIDYEIVWNTVKEDLPQLIEQLEEILKDFESQIDTNWQSYNIPLRVKGRVGFIFSKLKVNILFLKELNI